MDDPIYAVILDHEFMEVVHAERGNNALDNCQSYAQRLAETNQGIATVGVFKPLTKLEQVEIVKSHKTESNSAVLYAHPKKSIDEFKLV